MVAIDHGLPPKEAYLQSCRRRGLPASHSPSENVQSTPNVAHPHSERPQDGQNRTAPNHTPKSSILDCYPPSSFLGHTPKWLILLGRDSRYPAIRSSPKRTRDEREFLGGMSIPHSTAVLLALGMQYPDPLSGRWNGTESLRNIVPGHNRCLQYIQAQHHNQNYPRQSRRRQNESQIPHLLTIMFDRVPKSIEVTKLVCIKCCMDVEPIPICTSRENDIKDAKGHIGCRFEGKCLVCDDRRQ